MSQKAFISDLTWRSKEQQIKEICAFYDCLPSDLSIYDGPGDIPNMLRLTTRHNGKSSICMVSLAVLADNRMAMRAAAKAFNPNATNIVCIDDPKITGQHKAAEWIAAWQEARRRGAAKAGGEETARRAERDFWEGFAKIRDRWHLPAKKENASKPLLKEAETSRNTTRRYLGFTREEWQRMPENKRNRILERAYADR
jgi:hypothetical protein